MTNKILPRYFILIRKNLHGCSGQKGKCYLIRIAKNVTPQNIRTEYVREILIGHN